MDLNSDRTLFSNNSHNPHNPHSKSNAFRNKLYENTKSKSKSKSNKKSNKFHGNIRQINKIKYLEKYAHKYLISFYKNTINDYNIRMIDDILNNESTHLVAEFKDYLIMGDITEFLHKSYKINEIRKYLPKICIYYDKSSFIFPNYVTLHESKYIYKNIRKKQKVIDNQQEQEEKHGKKKGKISLENSEIFFSTKTFNSILDQTNTSNVKLIFGINDNIDVNETPNNIMDKLQKAENEANKRKINLVKNNKNKFKDIIQNEINNIYGRYNDNKNKKYNRNKSTNEKRNIIVNNNNNGNTNNSGAKRRNNIKLNNYIDSINDNDINSEKENDIQINNYMNMNPNTNRKINNYNDIPKNYNYIKSNSNMIIDANKGKGITLTDKYNYNTFYANNTIQSKTQNIKKFSIDNKRVKHHQKYFGNQNNYNKNLKKQVINFLFPSKSILTKVFINNFEDNNFIPSRTSTNFMDKNKMIKNNINMNQMVRDSDIPTSPSSIQAYRNKYKESNSTKNITNAKLNDNIRTKQISNIKRNNSSNHKIINYNYNNNTITTTSSRRTINKEEKTKNRQTHKNFSYNKTLTINKNNENIENIDNNDNNEDISSYRTIRNNSPNYNRSINNINSININNINNYIVKNINIQKINSSSNIQKSINMNMNININMNNNSYNNKIYCNNCSSTNIMRDKAYSKSPAGNELQTIKASKKKRTLYPRTKTFSELSNYNYKHQNIYNDCNSNVVKSINNNSLSNENNYIVDSFTHTTHTLLNTNNINNLNEDIYYNGGNNYINSKKKIFMEGLYRKNSIVLPFNREINNINININGYNPSIGCLTSRASNNGSKTKYKRNNDIQGTNLNSPENKTSNINRSKINKKNNNLLSRNEVNPVKIKNMYDSIQNSKFISNNRMSGYLTSRIAKF